MSLPTILVIHGAWHSPQHYTTLTNLLTARGYPVITPSLPTPGAPPYIGLKEDVVHIRSILHKLVVDESKDVIVIGHSYGGVVMTDSVLPIFSQKERSSKGLRGGVKRLVYICAFLLREGERLIDPLGGGIAPFVKTDNFGMTTVADPGAVFYSDIPANEHQKWIDMLKPMPAIIQLTPISNTAWAYVPSVYLVCEGDQAIPSVFQRMMLKNCKDAGCAIEERSCSAGHSPFMSQPEVVVDLVDEFANT